MNRKYKILTIFIIISVIINILSGCIIDLNDGFNNKEEVIELVKENIDDIETLSKELSERFHKFDIIQNNSFLTFRKSYKYKTKLSNKIFNMLKIEYVAPNKHNRVKYVVKNKFGYRCGCGFYYSFDDNKNYYTFDNDTMLQLKKEGMYIELGKKTFLLDLRHGWYTEKICDNWYFFEEDFDNLNFMTYIYDDLINMNPKSKYFEENKTQFERYNPHKQEVYEE